MITKMTARPTTPKMTMPSQSGDCEEGPDRVAATRDTMPAKMMKLMPLPIPFSVISSPSHISITEPAVRATIWVRPRLLEAELEVEDRAVADALRLEQGQDAVCLEEPPAVPTASGCTG